MPKTGEVYYNNSAFENYPRLKWVADHEGIHSLDVKSGKAQKREFNEEEFLTYKQNYKNSGLYKGLHLDNSTGTGLFGRVNIYLNNSNGSGFNLEYKFSKFWDFIYNLPRRF